MLWGFSTVPSAFTEVLAAKHGLGWFVTVLVKIQDIERESLWTTYIPPDPTKWWLKCLQKVCSHGAGGVLRPWSTTLFRFPCLFLLSSVLKYKHFGTEISFFELFFSWTVFSYSILSSREEEKWVGICTCHKPVRSSPVECKCHISTVWLRKYGCFFTLSVQFWLLVDFFLRHIPERAVLQRLSDRSTIILSSWNEQIISNTKSTSGNISHCLLLWLLKLQQTRNKFILFLLNFQKDPETIKIAVLGTF